MMPMQLDVDASQNLTEHQKETECAVRHPDSLQRAQLASNPLDSSNT